jgi:hypothetical protein
MKDNWEPAWVSERREPAFIGGDNTSMHVFGPKKFLWGNVPALDVLRLDKNEGDGYTKELRLLFAGTPELGRVSHFACTAHDCLASGDLRNVIKTIASIPEGYCKPITMTINDRDFDIVARNVIILLATLVAQDINLAVDCMIHIWYSVLVPKSVTDFLKTSIYPLIETICKKIENKKPESVLGKTWTFGSRSLRLVLPKEKWTSLLSYFEVPDGLSPGKARDVRAAIAMAEERRDYRERNMILQPPAHRICVIRYREDGILLPFGNCRDQFDIPNPSVLDTAVVSL